MTDSKGSSQEEDDFTFTETNMESNPASSYPVNHFVNHFAPPPNYSRGDTYKMGNLPPRATVTSGATGNYGPSETPRAVVGPGATGGPAATPEEPFNFSFYAPLKSKKRYWIALLVILLLVIAGLTALSGILAQKLSTQPKPQNITITRTEQFSTTATSIQYTTVNVTLTSFISLTKTQHLSFTTTTILTTTLMPTPTTATETASPIDKPSPSPTIGDSAHAWCLAADHPGGGADIHIWENYMTSQSQETSLTAALDKRCGLNLAGTGWTTTPSERQFGLPDDKEWVSKAEHTFVFANAVLPEGLQCIQQAVIDAGGPAIPSCGYTPDQHH